MRTSEREARIRELLPLVRRIARRVRRLLPGVDIGDLVGDGSIGLIRAVDNFDPSRGTTLEHYARRLILGAMLNGVRRMDPVSERSRRTMRDGEAVRYRIAAERGSLPPSLEIERMRPGFMRARAAVYAHVPLSLDAPLPEGESLCGDWSEDPAQILLAMEKRSWIRQGVASLPARQQHLVREHYYCERSLREVSKGMGISAQRASQLHVAAMVKLRRRMRAAD